MEIGKSCCFSNLTSNVSTLLITITITLVVIRFLYVIYWCGKPFRTSLQPISTLIVLGSGGHTAEMLNLLSVLQTDRFTPRFYIAAATDNMSLQKARVFENSLVNEVKIAFKYPGTNFAPVNLKTPTGEPFRLSHHAGGEVVELAQFMQIYRSREVGQSYLTSVVTTLVAMAHALWLMMKIRPQVILCNGPGTCIPLCVIAFFLKVLGIRWSSIFYVESIARVRRLSLSGLLLYKLRMADQLFVQWPRLQSKYPRAHYVGRLM